MNETISKIMHFFRIENKKKCNILDKIELIKKCDIMDVMRRYSHWLNEKVKLKEEDGGDDAANKYEGQNEDYKLLAQSKYFDAKWYLEQYPEVKEKGLDPIEHYRVRGWKKGYNPSVEFDGNIYLKTYLIPRNKSHNPLIHYLKYPNNKTVVPLSYNSYRHDTISKMKFLWRCFTYKIKNNKTNRKAVNYQIIAKSEYFNKIWYLKEYPDVVIKGVDPVDNYLKRGWKEGRNPSIKFNNDRYLEANPDVKAANRNPLLHYEKKGKKEGRQRIGMDNYDLTLFEKIREIWLPIWGKIIYHQRIKQNQNARILVVLHLFYMEAWPYIKRYLKNLTPYNYDLIVTYIKDNYKETTLAEIKKFKPTASFYAYPNYGFDIGPFIDVLSKINLSDYDIIYKLHSKGVHRQNIFIYNQIFKLNDWFLNLFDGILSGCAVHKAIDILLNNEKVGFVAADNLLIEDPIHKKSFTQEIAEKYGIKIKENYHYVAGSCFAIKSDLLTDIQNLKLKIEDFEQTERGIFSLAHAMERLVCAAVEPKGYEGYGIKVIHHVYKKELKQREKNSSLRLLDDKRFRLDYDFFYKVLEQRQIKYYEVRNVKLKDIRRRWIDGTLYNLEETSVYAYLKGDTKKYEDYCIVNAENTDFVMNKERYDKLLQSIKENYDKTMVPVLSGQNNIVIDGQHRLSILYYLYGKDYEVPCLCIYSPKDRLPHEESRPTCYDKYICAKKEKNPLISVVVASYNYADLIIRTLDSLVAQTYKNFEIIVVDDGSQDDSVAIIQKYVEKYPFIKLYRHSEGRNEGLPATVKLGVDKSAGEYVAFCESDDYWDLNYLEEKVKIINNYANPNIIINDLDVFGDRERCARFQRIIDNRYVKYSKLKNRISVKDFRNLNYIMTFSCCMVKKSELLKCNFLDVPRRSNLDWWLWRQLCFNNSIWYVDKKLTHWYMHDSYKQHENNDEAAQQKALINQSDKLLKKQHPFCYYVKS